MLAKAIIEMNTFSGFPEGQTLMVRIPEQFFSKVLPHIDDLGELRVTVYFFWRLERMEGTFRYMRKADFTSDADFMMGFGVTEVEAITALDEALQRAVARGTLLEATIPVEDGEEGLFFLNSPKGRAALKAIQQGEWRPSGEVERPVEFGPERPNVFRLYEENVGPLTPMIAETLRDAEETYSAEWIEEAIRIAVENNKRNWRYIEAILRRWQERGPHEGRGKKKAAYRRDTEKDRRRYADWEDPER